MSVYEGLAPVLIGVFAAGIGLSFLLADRDLLRRGYKVQKGDSLAKIAKKFDLTLGGLARINGVAREHEVEPGDVLVVYVDKKHNKSTTKPPKPRPTSLAGELEVASDAAAEKSPGTREASTAETAKLPGRDR